MKEMHRFQQYAFSHASSKLQFSQHYLSYVYVVYTIMIKRIERGYSAEELSFLLGKPPNYIAAIEDLGETELCLEELNLLRIIFNCELQEFFKPHQENRLFAVAMRKISFKNAIFYEAFKSTAEGVEELLFKLWEEVVELVHAKDNSGELDVVKSILTGFLQNGYFSERPKLACEILSDCNQLAPKAISPGALQMSLEEMIRENQLQTTASTSLIRTIAFKRG